MKKIYNLWLFSLLKILFILVLTTINTRIAHSKGEIPSSIILERISGISVIYDEIGRNKYPLSQLENLVEQNKTLLDSADLDLFRPIIESLDEQGDDVFRLEETYMSLQELILNLKNSRLDQLMSPFRQELIAAILPSMRASFVNLYEHLLLNPVRRPQLLTDTVINTPQLAAREAFVAGILVSETEMRDVFSYEQLAFQPQDRWEGQWATRSKIAINYYLNGLIEGRFFRGEISLILRRLIQTGRIPEDYAQQIYDAPPPKDTDETYPAPENRRISAELIVHPKLQLNAIIAAYQPVLEEANQLRQQIVDITHHSEVPATLTLLQNMTREQLRTQLHQLERVARQAHHEREAQSAEVLHEQQQRLDRLRLAAANALGLPPHELHDTSEVTLTNQLRTRLGEVEPRLTSVRIQSMQLDELISRISRIVNLQKLMQPST